METPKEKNKDNVDEISNIIPEQKTDNKVNQRKRKISSDTLEKITINRQVTKDLKRTTTVQLSVVNVQNAIEHLDNIVSKMKKQKIKMINLVNIFNSVLCLPFGL